MEATKLEDIDRQFVKLTETIMGLDELDKCRYLRFVASKILAAECQIQTPDLISMGDLIQQTEIVCAKLKKIIVTTQVEVTCKKCEKCIKQKLEHHLQGLNSECPHTQFEFVDDNEFKEAMEDPSVYVTR